MSDSNDQDDVDLLSETEDVKNVLENRTGKEIETIDLNEIYEVLEGCLKNGTTKKQRLKEAADIMESRLQKREQKRRKTEEANGIKDISSSVYEEIDGGNNDSNQHEDYYNFDFSSDEISKDLLQSLIHLYPDVDRQSLQRKTHEFGSDWKGLERWMIKHVEELPERQKILAISSLGLNDQMKMQQSTTEKVQPVKSNPGVSVPVTSTAPVQYQHSVQATRKNYFPNFHLSGVVKKMDKIKSQCPECESWRIVKKGETIGECDEVACGTKYCILCSLKDHTPFRCRKNDEIYRKRVPKDTNNIFKPLLELPTSQSEGVKRFVMSPKNDMDWTNPLDILYMAAEATFLRMVDRAPSIARNITRRSIVSIEYIENHFNTVSFLAKRDNFLAKGINNKERLCFHGTPIKNIDGILQNNFSDDKIKRCAYGRGHYFSEFPDVSAGYGPGLLLCRVLLGKSLTTDTSNNNIPYGYNSKVVRPDQDGKGWYIVIPDSHQILPAFVIKLREEKFQENTVSSHLNRLMGRAAALHARHGSSRPRLPYSSPSHTTPSASSTNVNTTPNSGNPNMSNVRVSSASGDRPHAYGNPWSTSSHPSSFLASFYAHSGVSTSSNLPASGANQYADASANVSSMPPHSGSQENIDANTNPVMSNSSNPLASGVTKNSDSAAFTSNLAQPSISGPKLYADTNTNVSNLSNSLASTDSLNGDKNPNLSKLSHSSASGANVHGDAHFNGLNPLYPSDSGAGSRSYAHQNPNISPPSAPSVISGPPNATVQASVPQPNLLGEPGSQIRALQHLPPNTRLVKGPNGQVTLQKIQTIDSGAGSSSLGHQNPNMSPPSASWTSYKSFKSKAYKYGNTCLSVTSNSSSSGSNLSTDTIPKVSLANCDTNPILSNSSTLASGVRLYTDGQSMTFPSNSGTNLFTRKDPNVLTLPCPLSGMDLSLKVDQNRLNEPALSSSGANLSRNRNNSDMEVTENIADTPSYHFAAPMEIEGNSRSFSVDTYAPETLLHNNSSIKVDPPQTNTNPIVSNSSTLASGVRLYVDGNTDFSNLSQPSASGDSFSTGGAPSVQSVTFPSNSGTNLFTKKDPNVSTLPCPLSGMDLSLKVDQNMVKEPALSSSGANLSQDRSKSDMEVTENIADTPSYHFSAPIEIEGHSRSCSFHTDAEETLIPTNSSIKVDTAKTNTNPNNNRQSSLNLEEIMSQNNTNYSNAISIAFPKALNGEFTSAIQTLMSAIRLLKESEVAHDDRCKILISSLQGILSNIEFKVSSISPKPTSDKSPVEEDIDKTSRKKDFEERRQKRDEKKNRRQNQNGAGRSRSRDRIIQTKNMDKVEESESKKREVLNNDGEDRSRSEGDANGNKSSYKDTDLENHMTF